MRRRLVNFLTTLSLVLFAATAALWVRSLWVYDAVGWFVGQEGSVVTVADLTAHAGAIGLGATSVTLPPGAPTENHGLGDLFVPGWHADHRDWPVQRKEDLLPDWAHQTGTLGGHGAIPLEAWYLLVPYWLPALLFLILPTFSLAAAVRRRRRRRRGCCARCGYGDCRAKGGACVPAVATTSALRGRGVPSAAPSQSIRSRRFRSLRVL